MAQEEAKDEEKFEFTPEGEALGYMSRGPSVGCLSAQANIYFPGFDIRKGS